MRRILRTIPLRFFAEYAVWFLYALGLAVMLVYALLHPVDLASADLGRHLINGREAVAWLFEHGPSTFLHANTYSYTAPDFPMPNHHWASGMVFWIIYTVFGFAGLSVGYIGAVLLGVAGAVWLAARAGSWRAGLVLVPLCIPLFAYRDEVRPEVFSFLFVPAVALICLALARSRRVWAWVALLLTVQVLWANMHVYFFLGPAVTAAFFVDALWYKHKQLALLLAWCMLGQVAASLCTPNGLWGVWYPVTILQNYGYRVLENQTIWFLWEYGIRTPAFWVFVVVLALAVLSMVCAGWRRKTAPVWAVCLALGGIVMGLFAVRNLALAGLLLLPLCAWAMQQGMEYLQRRGYQVLPVWILSGVLACAVLLGALLPAERTAVHGAGVDAGTVGLAAFMQRARLSGPIFNNYDVGGLLIWSGYPQVRVFVDNRPEAYAATFFSDVYIPMQEQASVFDQVDAEYQFRTIVFNYRDMTPWAQTFLRRALGDEQWVPVYVDNAVLVLARNVPANAELIGRYALPRTLFQFTSPQ